MSMHAPLNEILKRVDSFLTSLYKNSGLKKKKCFNGSYIDIGIAECNLIFLFFILAFLDEYVTTAVFSPVPFHWLKVPTSIPGNSCQGATQTSKVRRHRLQPWKLKK
jgi:hypothetical protein